MDQNTVIEHLKLFLTQSQSTEQRFDPQQMKYRAYGEDTATTPFDNNYTYHTAWAARRLAVIRPEYHVDIGSSLYFAVISSAFVPFKYYDFRPAPIFLSNWESGHADLRALHFDTNSIASISCMHTIEHVGLGRYGDPIDYDGDVKSMRELIRVTKPGGSILFVIPMGRPHVVFNAHRIYSYRMIMDVFGPQCDLEHFSLIPDGGSLVENAPESQTDTQVEGCGCFHFVKR